MSKPWPMVPLGEVLKPVSRPETVKSDIVYKLLGARWYAGGLYIKDSKAGSQIQAKTLYKVKEGDFVYNRLFAWKGSFAIASHNNEGCYVSNEFPCFEINQERADGKYLWRFFSRASVWEKALSLSTGGTPTSRNRLKEEKFLSLEIPLPPLPEQQCIMVRIEELAVKIEEARGLRRKAVEEAGAVFDAYLAKIFDCAYLGISPIPISQTDLKLNEETRNPSVSSPNEKFFYIDISSVETGKINQPKELFGHEAPSRARRVIRANNVIMSTVSPNLKAIAKIPAVFDEQICSTGFAVFSCSENISPDFLLYQLFSPSFIDQCLAMTTGGHYPAINDTNLRKVLIFVPPLPEQRRIVAYLDDLQAKVDSLKHLQTETQKELNAILPSVLDKAFKGEL